MNFKKALGKAIREIRKMKGLSQEDFSVVSSRTYLSSLERGMKSPTLDTLATIATRMGVHPITIITLAYMFESGQPLKKIHERIVNEIPGTRLEITNQS
jgi:transcriptional regulator with XRE-family HTH domain